MSNIDYAMKHGVNYQLPYIRGNQKAIRLKKADLTDKLYTRYELESLQNALLNLTPTTFKVWAYLCSNKHNYTFALKPEEVMGACNISRNTYAKSIRELQDKNYLRPAQLFPGFQGYILDEDGLGGRQHSEEYFASP